MGISITAIIFTSPQAISFQEWLRDYQTLVGAVLAISAAWFTVKAARLQVDHLSSLEETKNSDKLRAARSILPFALTKLVQYCETTSSELSDLLYSHEQMDQPQSGGVFVLSARTFKAAQLPEDVLERIQYVIECAPDDIARALGALLTNIQIYTSRLESLEEQSTRSVAAVNTSYGVIRMMINICELHSQASRCFEYGRFKSDSIAGEPISQTEIRSSAMSMRLNADDEMCTRTVIT